ncbi:methionine--tRNA ligase [Steroidobacter agaridevorans]|uniref:Methionine--tRNA ligase n=1 Tax=Steroidobacter agaridevorans TaxID=2695856 RepID=A0A829YQ02_9GAMM|nr:methionine--tRNA ligase [Steroidobacter agaridevorans]GFE84546.1 methionine--tRNA ligase [Steroidobacter agaridevorans]
MTAAPRNYFVTTALPYANGPFHIGHIMEYIQADIWVRFQRLQGHKVHWMGADDAHGAPIMLKAEAEGITPEELVARIAAGRPQSLNGFLLSFDHWHSTHSPENTELSQEIYRALKASDLIYREPVEQFFDPVKNMFLADRYIKGECPNCHSKDQYGDACEVCSSVYSPTDLINPYSTLSGAKPVLKSSDHFFFKLSDPRCVEFLTEWTKRLQPSVANKASEWLSGKGDRELGDWDISRDAPYFGIPIPDAPGKYFYVWLDAPVGYLASLKNYFTTGKAKANGEPRSFEQFIAADDVRQIHFIGKDIIYFHTLFWPAMLKFAGRKIPDNVYVHGFITVSGLKMSKSRGTGLSPVRYLDLGMNPEWLRYYLAAKLNANVEDIDFNPEDFVARVNSDLVGKYVNIASRCAGFITKRFGGKLGALDPAAQQLAQDFVSDSECWNRIGELYEGREFGKAMREIGSLLDRVNQYIDSAKPWELAKVAGEEQRLHQVCSTALNFFWYLTVLLAPVLPETARKVQGFLRLSDAQMRWGQHQWLPEGHEIGAYEHLLQRVDPKQLLALFDTGEPEVKPAAKATTVASTTPAKPAGETPPVGALAEVTVEDFAKLDLRIAKIVAADAVEGADKLLKLTLDLGESQRTVFAGIRSAYTPDQLVGRFTLMLANLKPRKMRFGTSEGMVLAAGPGGKEIFLLSPDSGATAGMKVK